MEPDRRLTGVVSRTGSGIITESGNQSAGTRPDRVEPSMPRAARALPDTRKRRGAAPRSDSRATRDRDAWQKGADRDAIGSSRVGTRKRKRRIAEMRARSRRRKSPPRRRAMREPELPESRESLFGGVGRLGGDALRRVRGLSRLGAPVGAGFRFVRDAASTGLMIARGVRDALRDRGGAYTEKEDAFEEEKPETDVLAENVETVGDTLSFDESNFDVKEDESGRVFTRKETRQKRKPAAKKTPRRSSRRRAGKNAASRRR